MAPERPILLDVPEELVGERIIVRRFRDTDAEPFHQAISESIEHVRPWLPWYDQHRSIDDTLAFLRRAQGDLLTRASMALGIFARSGGESLGGIGLVPREWRVPSFELGYWVRQSAEGKGYVTEAAQLLTIFAFETLGAERVMIRCDTRNGRSRAIPERLGYVYEGCLRRSEVDTAGNPADMAIYAMVPVDFSRARAMW